MIPCPVKVVFGSESWFVTQKTDTPARNTLGDVLDSVAVFRKGLADNIPIRAQSPLNHSHGTQRSRSIGERAVDVPIIAT